MIIVNLVAFCLTLIGAINWGLIGIFDWNLVTAIFGAGLTVGSRIVYILVFIAALWLIFYAIYGMGRISVNPMDEQSKKTNETKHQDALR